MGFAFYSQSNDEDKKKQHDSLLGKVEHGVAGFFSHPSEIPGKVARGFFGNTAKFVNQAVQEGKQAVDTGKMITANATHNDEAFQHANDQANKDRQGFKDNGGFFNAGTFTNAEEAKKGDLKTGLQKIGGGTIGAATEIVPFAKGATLAKKGGSVGENLVRAGVEGAGYSAVGSTAQQLAENGKVDLKQTAIDALMGGATGAAGFGVAKGGEAAINGSKKLNGNLGEGGFVKIPEKKNLVNTDTKMTTPTDAQSVIAAEAAPKSMDIIAPAQRAKTALTGVEAPSVSQKIAKGEEAVTPVGQGAQSIAQKLNDQLSTFDKNLAAPDEIIKKLEGGQSVARDARKHDWLNHYEDTLSVLGRHFGQTGTDLGYKLAEGAKKVSDIQEVVRPSIDKTQKLLNGMSKSKAGRADIQSRVYSALEDRANAQQYIHTPKEQELYDETAKVFDFFKQQRQAAGKSVIENDYSPRAAVSNALDAPERLLDDAHSAFSTNVQSRFSKKRLDKIPDAEINRNIIDLLPSYSSSQAKEFAYEGAMDFAKKELPNVNPAYMTDAKSRRQGEDYLRELMTQVLDPPTVSKSERLQNKLIGNTYKSQLGWSPRFAFQNMTQRFATKAVVSKEAVKLAGKMDKTDTDMLRKSIISGDNPITAEITNTADSVGKKGVLSKFEPGQAVERGNVHEAFDRGSAQAIVSSDKYKAALKTGMKPREAAKFALQDPEVRDLATRHGNLVVNDTQFGANFVTKPEFFRESGTFFGLSDKWFKQYQRFPQGMIQNMSTILRGKDARALDILKRGNPAETKLVDFKYSAQALHNGVDDLITGIKNGEVHDVSLEVAQGYKKTLGKAIDELDKQMKAHSQIRGGKTAKNVAKMWAAASAIQFLFDGGLAMTGDNQSKEVKKAAQYGAPLNIPSRDSNPLAAAAIPNSPFRPTLQPNRLLNFVPVVGTVVNRGHDVNKLVKALTGDNQ